MSRKRKLERYRRQVVARGLEGLRDGSVVPGHVYTIDVVHEERCDLAAGRGPCNCNPTIRKPRLVNTEDQS